MNCINLVLLGIFFNNLNYLKMSAVEFLITLILTILCSTSILKFFYTQNARALLNCPFMKLINSYNNLNVDSLI